MFGDLLTLVYSPERKLCSKPLNMVRGMRVSSLQSFSSLNVARKVWQNGSRFSRNSLVWSRSMLSRNTATMSMASTPTPTTQHGTVRSLDKQNTLVLPRRESVQLVSLVSSTLLTEGLLKNNWSDFNAGVLFFHFLPPILYFTVKAFVHTACLGFISFVF